jgi:shikimate kinase
MKVRAVFLVGYMASGNTSAVRELARCLGWDFLDLDTHVESREQQTIPQLFARRGESGLRVAETKALQRISVVALGGGTFVQQSNREILSNWPSVFLEAPAAELWQRSLTDRIERPLRGSLEDFDNLYAERLPFYRQATMTVVTSGKDLNAICSEIRSTLQCWDDNKTAGSFHASSNQTGTGESQ